MSLTVDVIWVEEGFKVEEYYYNLLIVGEVCVNSPTKSEYTYVLSSLKPYLQRVVCMYLYSPVIFWPEGLILLS